MGVGDGGWGMEQAGGGGEGKRRRDTEESGCWNENGKLFFSSLENMMNGDMRKAHYVHDDEKKMLLVVLKG